ncbi:MAG TPA: transglutaminase domain-containing protein [Casimicrobiaceae bacterium]|jgi:transglutaminase-like putative cysteine protease
MPVPRPPLLADARRRVADEASIVALVALYGWAIELRRGERDNAEREAREALERWVSLGLPFARGADGVRRFDPVEVIGFYKHAGRALDDPFLPRAVAQSRALVLAFHEGAPSTQSPPRVDTLGRTRFDVSLERTFDIARGARGEPLLLRVPLPVDDGTLDGIAIEYAGPADAKVEISPGRLDVRLPHPGTATIPIGVRVSFWSDPSRRGRERVALDAAQAALYTRASEGLVKVSERVAALAARLAAGVHEPLAVLDRFVDFLTDEITIGAIHYDRLDRGAPLDTVLESRWCDCQMASALLVALCRAHGIPARLVSGYLLTPATPSGHYWAEAWIDGTWRPFDSAAADLAAGGRDSAWRDYYFGRVDHRMTTQVLPRVFNLAPSVRLPPLWHTLQRLDGDAVAQTTVDDATGALVFRDRIAVQRGTPSTNATPL